MQQQRDIVARRLYWRPLIVSGTLCSVRSESGALGLVTETFRFRNGCSFDTALMETEFVRRALGAEVDFCIAPLGFPTESGDESDGTVSDQGFRIVHTRKKTTPLDIMSDAFTDHERDFLARLHLTPALSFRYEDWGYAPLIHARRVKVNNGGSCVIVIFVAPEGLSASSYRKLSSEVSDLLGGAKVQFSDEEAFDSSMIVSLTIDSSSSDDGRFIDTDSLHLGRVIDRLRAKE